MNLTGETLYFISFQSFRHHGFPDIPSHFHTFISQRYIETMDIVDHNFLKSKLDVPESNAFPPRTVPFLDQDWNGR